MKVFINYAREDCKVARRFHDDIQKPGIEPWIDTSDIEGGSEWAKGIEQAINESEYFLALISNISLSKKYVKYEWELALQALKEENIHIIPIRLEPFEPSTLPKKLFELQLVDLFPPVYEKGLKTILRGLNRAKASANFEETFSSLGPDNDGWDLSEWSLNNVDHTGKGSQSIYGEAVPSFNAVTKTASITLPNVENATTLQFYRKLNLFTANFMAKAGFKAILDDGVEHIIDDESQKLESDWIKRAIDLSPYSSKTITLKFVASATDPLSVTSYAKVWIDDIVVS